jgi:hypothetical protein
MPDTIPDPPSVNLIPPPPELRHRLAVALREVDLLRRLIRVAEYAKRIRTTANRSTPNTVEQEGRGRG